MKETSECWLFRFLLHLLFLSPDLPIGRVLQVLNIPVLLALNLLIFYLVSIENWYSVFSPKNPPYPDLIYKYFHPQVTLSLWPLPEGTSIIWMLQDLPLRQEWKCSVIYGLPVLPLLFRFIKYAIHLLFLLHTVHHNLYKLEDVLCYLYDNWRFKMMDW